MPNRSVLLLIADDWSELAKCYGNDVVSTPNIDGVARQGVVFDQAFCTTPSCAASRANLLTGLYSHQHGQYGHSHGIHGFRTHEKLATRTLPAVLKQAGVFTGLVGKDHIAPKWVYPFDVDQRYQPWSVESLREGARSFFEQAGKRPFYLQVASMYPHRTGGNFNRDQCGEELKAGDVVYDPAKVVVPDWLPDVPEVRADLAAYHTFVSRYDRFVGAVLRELERSGRADDTMVIVMTDHGMPFPGAKASMYDSGHHCPLIVHRPGDAPGRNRALVNWCDIFPTVCDWLGVPADQMPQLPGRSLLPIIDQPDPAGWDRTFFSHTFHEVTNYYPYRVVRGRRFKLVRNLAHGLPLPLATDLFDSATWQAVRRNGLERMGKRLTERVLHHAPEEFYDLENDPVETTNVIDDPAFAAEVRAMRSALEDFRLRTGDPWLELDYQAGKYGKRPANDQ